MIRDEETLGWGEVGRLLRWERSDDGDIVKSNRADSWNALRLLKNRKKRDVACEPNYRLKDSCMGRNTSEARFVTTALVTFSISTIVDYKDRSTCILFGDGAGAVLIEPAEGDEIGLIDFVHEIDGSGGVALNLKGGGSLNPSSHETVDKKMHYIFQDGPTVYKFAVRKMAEATSKVLERNGVTGAELGCFIPHQANKRIITATADRLGMDPARVIINIEKYGNTSAGTIPLAMETAVEEGKLNKGDLVLLAAAGAGFTVGAALLRWEI